MPTFLERVFNPIYLKSPVEMTLVIMNIMTIGVIVVAVAAVIFYRAAPSFRTLGPFFAVCMFTGALLVRYGTLKRVAWYFEEGGVVLCRGWRGTLTMVVWYFEESGVVL